MKLYWKILLTALIPLILVLGLGLYQVNRSIRIHEAGVASENRLKTSLLQVRLSAFLDDLKKTAAIISGSRDVERAVQAGDTDFLTSWGSLFLFDGGLENIIIADRSGTVLARPGDPFRFGDSVSDHPAFIGAMAGKDIAAFYEMDGFLSIVCVNPIKLYGEDPVGVVFVTAPVTYSLLSFFPSATGIGILVEPEGFPPVSSSPDLLPGKGFLFSPSLISEGVPMKRVEVFFPDDQAIVPLSDLHNRMLWVTVFIFVVLPVALLILLRRHLRPYSNLMAHLMPLTEKGADLEEIRRGLEQDFRQNRHEVAAVASAVVRILKLLEEKILLLEKTSRTDPLTQVSNRLHLDRLLQAEMERSASEEEPLSVIIIDLDHFKDVNDVFGHQAGDRVLYRAAQILKETAGPGAFVGRWGGEEFLIILPSVGEDSACREGENLRKAVEKGDFAIERYVTISLGIATMLPGDTPSTLVHRADKGLYRAKAEGRNRTVLGRE
ncbi:diguanylate cyclase [Aminivibrio sp.]|uniref:diguanylate cyclase n=1 Tax=Aminivibrio sp. TaxID=1872489 RepID=UPI00345E17B8